mgnify:CR=1 FL=1
MHTIDTENSKKIRHKMEVICGLDAASGVTGTVTATGAYALDSNKIQDIGLIPKLADLAGDGFPLDGSRACYSDSPDELTKYGYQSADIADEDGDLSTPLVITVTASDLGEITIIFEEMSTFGFSYQLDSGSAVEKDVADRIMLDCTGHASLVITIDKWTPGSRAKLARIFMGKCYQFNNDNLVSCILTLRAGLTVEPTLPFSEIEIQGHIMNDISDEISYIPDNSPIWYSSGYPGDMSAMRKFYLQKEIPIEYNDKIAVIKGYDETYKLDSDFLAQYVTLNYGYSKRDLYRLFKAILTAAGITYTAESEPTGASGYADNYFLFKDSTRRDVIAFLQNLIPIRFVDAGIPYLFHSASRHNVWRINDYSKVENEIEQHINEILVKCYSALENATSETIETVTATTGEFFEQTYSDYYTGISVTNAIVHSVGLNYVTFKALSNGDCVVTGKLIEIYKDTDEYNVVDDKEGRQADFSSIWDVDFICSGELSYLDYVQQLLNRSSKKRKFTWKGDPRMMPFDVIYLGTDDTPYTIESMTLEHSGGGLSSQIEVREGVI